MNSTHRPITAITMGDPAGIGAEIIVKALSNSHTYELTIPVVVGDRTAMADALRITDNRLKLRTISDPSQAEGGFGVIDLISVTDLKQSDLIYGQIDPTCGWAAYQYIEKSIALALDGQVNATVTGPIHKEALNDAGYHYSGHTEIFAQLTGTKDYAMMLANEEFRVVHVSTHVSLRRACDLVTRSRVLKVIELTHDALKLIGKGKPVIGVAGLNPHAGEGGMFGQEEISEISPAILDAKNAGIEVDGPIPPDTVFVKMRGGLYDAVVVMYHDQGHIPLKTVGFSYDRTTGKWEAVAGINVTLGLPIIRTSVDHGVAFDKAGTGTANPQSMEQAIEFATQLAEGKAKQNKGSLGNCGDQDR